MIPAPGHAEARGNEQADRVASKEVFTSRLKLGKTRMPRGLWNFLSKNIPEHHNTDHLKETRERKRSKLYLPRWGIICVSPDQHWHCLRGNFRGTAEKRGGAGTLFQCFLFLK